MTISMKMRLTNEKDTDFLIVDPFLMACAGTDGGSLRRSIGKCSAPSPHILARILYLVDCECIMINCLRRLL